MRSRPSRWGHSRPNKRMLFVEISKKITENFSVDIELSLVLPNKVDTRTKLAEEYLESFEAEYGDTIAPNYVPYSQDIRNAAQRGVTAFELENPSATAKKAKNGTSQAA